MNLPRHLSGRFILLTSPVKPTYCSTTRRSGLIPLIKQLTEEKLLLTGRGLQVFNASSCEEALDIYRREGVNLIITGLDLPGTIEDNLCSIVRRDETLRDVSILAVCRNRAQDIERCVMSGANAYVRRPIDPDLFLKKVVFLLNIANKERRACAHKGLDQECKRMPGLFLHDPERQRNRNVDRDGSGHRQG
jgi:CheY-like chemotaxis protein